MECPLGRTTARTFPELQQKHNLLAAYNKGEVSVHAVFVDAEIKGLNSSRGLNAQTEYKASDSRSAAARFNFFDYPDMFTWIYSTSSRKFQGSNSNWIMTAFAISKNSMLHCMSY